MYGTLWGPAVWISWGRHTFQELQENHQPTTSPWTLDPGGSCSWRFLPFLACLTMETTALYKAVKYSEFFISDIKCQNQFCTCKHSISPLEVKPIEGYFSMWVFRAVIASRCHLRLSESRSLRWGWRAYTESGPPQVILHMHPEPLASASASPESL